MKTFKIFYWDNSCNSKIEEVKALNIWRAEWKFKTEHPKYFVKKVEEINCKEADDIQH